MYLISYENCVCTYVGVCVHKIMYAYKVWRCWTPCSGMSNIILQIRLYKDLGNEWYCDAHRPIDASIEMSDSSDEDDKVVYSRVSHRFLNPVVSAQKEVNQFKQSKCNHGNCAILTFCHIDISVWICPIHENLQ